MKTYEKDNQLLICTERSGHQFKAMTGVKVLLVIDDNYLVHDLEPPYQQGFVNGADLMDVDEVRELMINNPKMI